MTDNMFSVPIPQPRYDSSETLPPGGPDYEPWCSGHTTGVHFTDINPAPNYSRYGPPSGPFTGNTISDDPPAPAMVPRVAVPYTFQDNQTHRMTQPPENAQYVPVTPGPPRLEYQAHLGPDIHNNSCGVVPGPTNAPGPSQGIPDLGYHRMAAAEALKRIAGQYLHSPSSQVDKLRMRRSRSGGLKVLILLEIDDTM